MQAVFRWLDAHPMAVYLFFGVVLVVAAVRPSWIVRVIRPRVHAGESEPRGDEEDEEDERR